MKYIVLVHQNQNTVNNSILAHTNATSVVNALSVPAIYEAIEATRPYLDNLRKNDKIVDWGFFGANHGLYAIFNVKNHAELYEYTELLPMRSFCTIDCTPVLEGAEFGDTFGKVKRESIANFDRLQKISTSKNNY